jgi:ERCC4-type nuclease
MKITLLIDIRENIKLRNLIEESHLFKDIDYKFQTLDVGDYLFTQNTGEKLFIIERKEIADLANSIKDKKKRYHEQKYRLCNDTGLNKTRIMYLIEGYTSVSKSNFIQGLPKDTILSSFVNTIARDQIQVYHTENFNETLLFLSKLYHSLSKHTGGGQKEYSDLGRLDGTTKGAKLTPSLTFRYQLMSYPGISPEAAKIIENKYHSFPELITSWNKYPGNPEYMLADLVVHGKRLGNTRSKRLFEYFFNEKKD